MDFSKKSLFVLVGVLVVALTGFVIAQTITGFIVVNTFQCNETDFGWDIANQGSITGTFFATNGNVTTSVTGTLQDTCFNNVTLIEGVCGSSISVNISNLAAAGYVNCLGGNTSNFTGCFQGACV